MGVIVWLSIFNENILMKKLCCRKNFKVIEQ